MAKEPQRDFPMSDDLRDKMKIAFRGAQRGPRDNPNRLERYLLLGYKLGSLQKYDLIPTIRDGIGAGWITFYNDLWLKVTDPKNPRLQIILVDDSFIEIPYSILNREFALAMGLFELFALQNGKQLKDFHNLSEANYFYSTPAFEKLVNDFLVRRELEQQELYAIQEEIHMEDCSEECSYEELTPIPIIPESIPVYMQESTYGPAPGYVPMSQQTYVPQSRFVPSSAPEPMLNDKIPKKEVMMTERQKEREKQKKKERERRKRKEKDSSIEKDLKNEVKRLKEKAKERVETDESGEKVKEDEPIEISPVKEKEMAPKENTKVVDEHEQDSESESEMEFESDFEESFEKKPLVTMAKRTKKMEKERKRKQEFAKPRENHSMREKDKKPIKEVNKIAKQIYNDTKNLR